MRSTTLIILSLLMSLGVSAAPEKPNKDKTPKTVPGQYVVKLSRNLDTFDRAALEKLLGGRIASQLRPNMIVLQRPPVSNFIGVARVLTDLPEVVKAEPNYIIRAFGAPNDPEYGRQWNFKNTGGADGEGLQGVAGIDLSMEEAWKISTGSKNIVVAVIDTGVNYRHADLQNNMWVNEREKNGQPGVDDDGNGYIDDIHGFNFVNNTGDPMDDHGHGSHCAGVIGAEGNNGVGVSGVNWKVSIMAVKFLGAGASGSIDAAIKAVDYARKNGAMILSNSWGGNFGSDLLQEAVRQTFENNQLFVAAAGNDGRNNDNGGPVPAAYNFENVMAVAAINNRGELASFSNYGGRTVPVSAPGVAVLSTGLGQNYFLESGTSMAAPHVAGLAALIWSANPTMTWRDVKARLISSSRPLGGLRALVGSGGFINGEYALTGATPPADPNDPVMWTSREERPFSSVHPYTANLRMTHTITVPGAKRIAVHFAKFETEAGYDKLSFTNADGQAFGEMSGTRTGMFGPVVNGDTVNMTFAADSSVHGYGFDIDYVAVEY